MVDKASDNTSTIVNGIFVQNYFRQGLEIENASSVKIYMKFVNIKRTLPSQESVTNYNPLPIN